MTEEIIHCNNCGQPFQGNYCNNCGEKKHKEEEKKLKHVFEEAFHFLTHLDNKFLKSLRLVLFKPGTLSYKYCRGIRKQYFKPVGLFIICVIVYLLFPAFKGLNLVLGTYYSPTYSYYQYAAPIIEKKMKEKNVSFHELSKIYDGKSQKISKFLLLLYIPMCALVLFAMYFRNRKYFYDHFILATELNSFFIIVGFLLMPLFIFLLLKIPVIERVFTERMLGVLIASFFAFAVYSGVRKFYREKIGWSLLKTSVFLASYIFLIVPIYNRIIFSIVMSII